MEIIIKSSLLPTAGTPEGGRVLDIFRRDLLSTLGNCRLLWLPKVGDTTTNIDDSRIQATITYDADVAGDVSGLGTGVIWDLDGTVEEADTPNVTGLSFGDGAVDKALSVLVLINPDQITTAANFVAKWDNVNGSGQKREWRLKQEVTTGYFMLELYDDTANDFISREDQTALTADTWVFLAATYDGSGSVTGIRLYKDAVRVDDAETGAGSYVAMNNLATPLTIGAGRDVGGTDPTDFFNGEMGLVAITGKELNIDEVWHVKTLINSFFDLSL